MDAAPHPGAAGHAARIRLRILFVISLVGTTVATHWPRLELGTPQQPAPDKLLHFLTFGALTLLAWLTGWFPRRWRLWLIGLLWAGADELTQAFEVLQRDASWGDWSADAMGITIATLLLAALRPIGHAEAARRTCERHQVVWELFDSSSAWMMAACTAAVTALVAIAPMVILARKVWALPVGVTTLMGTMICSTAVTLFVIELQVRRRIRRRIDAGTPEWAALSGSATLRLMGAPSVTALLAMVATAFIWEVSLRWRGQSALIARAEDWYNALPSNLRTVMDLALVLAAACWALAWTRARIAMRVDRAHRVCVACGQSLEGILGERERARCPECGGSFRAPPTRQSPHPESEPAPSRGR